jgi:hypothetical protein
MPDDDSRTYAFDDVVAAHTGPEFVERRWLEDDIESALEDADCRYVLLTAEPGAGKTCLIAAMAHRRPERPRYFARRDSRAPLTGYGARTFLLSIGHQLARTCPRLFQPDRLDITVRQRVEAVLAGGRVMGLRIEDLQASPFHHTAVEVEQTASLVEGDIAAVEVGRMTTDPRLLTSDNLSHLALIAPAAALSASDPRARIVILVDALDEVADAEESDGLLAWLESGPELPSNVRLVITTRTHTKLELFRRRRVGQIREFGIDSRSTNVRRDLATYAERFLDTEAVTRAVESQDMSTEDLAHTVARRAEGNFAYLVAYGRALTEAINRLDDEFRDRLLRFADVPAGLDSLYGLFMETVRTDISRMGMMTVRFPRSATDTECPPWESVGQPVLGILVVAREPLTVKQITRLSRVRVWPRHVANVVARLYQFLDRTPRGLQLFHSSLAEFLLSEQVRRDHPEWAVEEQEWHECIVTSYRGDHENWADVDWASVDRYGLRHLANHLTRCGDHLADTVPDLVGPGLRRAQRSRFGTDREFLSVIDLAGERAITHLPAHRSLPTILFLGTAARYVGAADTTMPPAFLGLLARRGGLDEALDHLSAQPPSKERADGLLAALHNAPAHDLTEPRREELVTLLVHYASTIPPQRHWGGASFAERRDALRAAAIELAPYSVTRAQRLLARTGPADDRDDRRRGDKALSAADQVRRAAALAAAPEEAIELVVGMERGRARACLDLADRGPSSTRLLELAEDGLPTEDPGPRLVCQARLAAHWWPIDEQEGRRRASTVQRAITVLPASGLAEDASSWEIACVDAITHLAAVDPALARDLLGRRDGTTFASRIATAKLWARWGETARCRALLDDWRRHHEPGTAEQVRIVAVVATFDVEDARRLLSSVPPIEPAEEDAAPFGLGRRDDLLAHVARLIAPLEPGQAITLARRVSGQEWGCVGTERISALADVGHALLDDGQDAEADKVLAACREEIDTVSALGADTPPRHIPIRMATGAQPVGLPEAVLLSGYSTNTYSDWRHRCRRRLFLAPVDVVRNAPGPVGLEYGWNRTLRRWAEVVAPHRIDLAGELLDRVSDPGERAVGLAGAGTHAERGGDLDAAHHLLTASAEALRACPVYEWTFDRAATLDYFNRHKQAAYRAPGFESESGEIEGDTEDVLAYLLPDQRARFEVAVRRCLDVDLGEPTFGSPFLLRSYTAIMICAVASQVADWTPLGAPWPAEAIDFIHEQVVGLPPDGDRLDRVTRVHLVAAERILRHRSTWHSDGRHRAVPAVAPLAVPDPVDASLVDVLTAQAGLPVADLLAERLQDLLSTNRLPEVVHLAALAITVLSTTDTERARTLANAATTTLRRGDDAFLRAWGLAHLAAQPVSTDVLDTAALADEAAQELDGSLSSGDRADLLAVLVPTLVTKRPAAAARLMWTTLRTNWSEAIALLDWSAEALVDTYGTRIIEQSVAAVDRALIFRR